MRTTIDINERLMNAVMRLGEFKTKKEAVNTTLRMLVSSLPKRKSRIAVLAKQGRWERIEKIVATRKAKEM